MGGRVAINFSSHQHQRRLQTRSAQHGSLSHLEDMFVGLLNDSQFVAFRDVSVGLLDVSQVDHVANKSSYLYKLMAVITIT